MKRPINNLIFIDPKISSKFVTHSNHYPPSYSCCCFPITIALLISRYVHSDFDNNYKSYNNTKDGPMGELFFYSVLTICTANE